MCHVAWWWTWSLGRNFGTRSWKMAERWRKTGDDPPTIEFLTINHQPSSGYITINHEELGNFFHQLLTNPWVSYQQPNGYLPTKPIIGFLTINHQPTSGYITINHEEVGIFSINSRTLGYLRNKLMDIFPQNQSLDFLPSTINQPVGILPSTMKKWVFFHQLLTNPWVSYQQPIGYLPTKPTIVGFLTINQQPTSGNITINHEEVGIFPINY